MVIVHRGQGLVPGQRARERPQLSWSMTPACLPADRYAHEGNFLTVMPDLFPGLVSPSCMRQRHPYRAQHSDRALSEQSYILSECGCADAILSRCVTRSSAAGRAAVRAGRARSGRGHRPRHWQGRHRRRPLPGEAVLHVRVPHPLLAFCVCRRVRACAPGLQRWMVTRTHDQMCPQAGRP